MRSTKEADQPGLTDGLLPYHFVVVRVPQVHRPGSETKSTVPDQPSNKQHMEVYMNSLNPATSGMSISTNRNAHQSPQQQLASPEEEMQRQLDEFNRSVTIIIWYKANAEPIRLQQMLSTFPYFQLSHFNQLIDDLGLTTSSYLDTYIPTSSQWEQHTISSVRIVETQQRLLYKVRRSLMEGLSDEECSSLREEIQMQSRNGRPHPSSTANSRSSTSPNKTPAPLLPVKANPDTQISNPLKRSAPQEDTQDSRQSPKIHVSNGYYMTHTGTGSMGSSPIAGPSSSNTSTPNVTSSQSSAQSPDSSVYMYQSPIFYGGNSGNQGSPDANNSLPPYLLSPQTSAPPIPYHPHPPLKRWPNDYTVSELSSGFHAMDLLISQSPTGASMTQRTAFERVFGSRYVKSTVCRHRAVWRKAPRLLREQFEGMGTDDRACWGEFVRRVENRPPGKHSNIDLMSPTQGSSLGYHESQNAPEDDDVHGQESVMGSMQNQVSSNQNGNAMQNNINVYDPSRGLLATGGHNG